MTEALQRRAHELATALRDYAKELDKRRKALEALSDPAVWNERGTRERAYKALASDTMPPALEAFVDELGQGIRDFVHERRQTFVDRFFDVAKERSLTLTEMGQQPPVFDAGGVQVEIDFDKEEAHLSYGREPLCKTALEPVHILDARKQETERLEASWPGADVMFDAFASAYRARLGRENKPAGERVFLVDLLPELQLEASLRGLRGVIEDKAALAYCLDRLAREGALEREGQRIELGTATGGSTKDKKRVVFLRHGLGGGQYYLTARVGGVR
ncbi:MAG: hypothetical protein H6832_17050 [Planctomycetes bacterium]|nr:hypothetical protein [Planctomycetota bacterium]MCB9890666.1 hypothetical protein [Planctomycetota bacterium]MCB9920111.1 hypothetical protein [Planctomycetota bacterium]